MSSELARMAAAVLAVISIATLAPILNHSTQGLIGPATVGIERAAMQAGGNAFLDVLLIACSFLPIPSMSQTLLSMSSIVLVKVTW